MTTFPQATDYCLAIQNPAWNLDPPDLKACQPTLTPMGTPESWAGGWAITFRMAMPAGDFLALRCFHQPQDGLFPRYQAYEAFHRSVQGPLRDALLPCAFIARGILVDGEWQPIVTMPWVEGTKLDDWTQANAGRPESLQKMRLALRAMLAGMASAGFVHGDLQHGNILVRRGRPVLVDYDTVFPPGAPPLAFSLLGLPGFQHPGFSIGDDPLLLDRFPSLVIHTAFEALERLPGLARAPGAFAEALLFHAEDFEDPGSSILFRTLKADPGLRRRAEALETCARGPVSALPDLETFLRDSLRTERSLEPELSSTLVRALDRIYGAVAAPVPPAANPQPPPDPAAAAAKKPPAHPKKAAIPAPAPAPSAPPSVPAKPPLPMPPFVPARSRQALSAARPPAALQAGASSAPPCPPVPTPFRPMTSPPPAFHATRPPRSEWLRVGRILALTTVLIGGPIGLSAFRVEWKMSPAYLPICDPHPYVPPKPDPAPRPPEPETAENPEAGAAEPDPDPDGTRPQPSADADPPGGDGPPPAPPPSAASPRSPVPDSGRRGLASEDLRLRLASIRAVAEEELLDEQRQLEQKVQRIEEQIRAFEDLDPASRFELKEASGQIRLAPPQEIAARYRVLRAETLARIENLRLPLQRFEELTHEGAQRPDYLAAALRGHWNLPPRARRMIEELPL